MYVCACVRACVLITKCSCLFASDALVLKNTHEFVVEFAFDPGHDEPLGRCACAFEFVIVVSNCG